MKNWITNTLTAAAIGAGIALGMYVVEPKAAESNTITIPLVEYEKYKKLEEGDQRKQYWKMTFEQILEKESNNYTKAWDLYNFWVNRNIKLYGTVTDGAVSSLASQIETLNQISSDPITMTISSGGGSVLAGFTLGNVMAASKAPVNTVCDNFAMSMAAYVFAVGAHRTALEGCIFMIHEVSVGSPGGKTMEQVKWAETIIDVESMIVDKLSARSGLSTKDVRAVMEYETFWTAGEIVRLGFADEAVVETITQEQRVLPEDLKPLNRMKRNFDEKLSK